MFIMSAQFEGQVDSDVIVFIIQWFQWYHSSVSLFVFLYCGLPYSQRIRKVIKML